MIKIQILGYNQMYSFLCSFFFLPDKTFFLKKKLNIFIPNKLCKLYNCVNCTIAQKSNEGISKLLSEK